MVHALFISFYFMKKLFLASFFALLSICTYAYDFEVDGIYYNITGDNTVEVTSNNGTYTGDIIIPNKVSYDSKEYSVTSIGENAFYNCSSLTAINIPEGVTSIKEYAFYDCIGLTAISIPKGVTTIKYGTFQGCSGLTAISIPEGVTEIKTSAFQGCSGLTTINIPKSVTTIERQAFNYCSSLADIYYYASKPAYIYDNSFSENTYSGCTLHVPYGTMKAYRASARWKKFVNIVELDPTGIEAVSADGKSAAEQRIYNLGGVRMAAPQRGLNIINGKKVAY